MGEYQVGTKAPGYAHSGFAAHEQIFGVEVTLYNNDVLVGTAVTEDYFSDGRALANFSGLPDTLDGKYFFHDPANRFPDQWRWRKASQATADQPHQFGFGGVSGTDTVHIYPDKFDWVGVYLYFDREIDVDSVVDVLTADGSEVLLTQTIADYPHSETDQWVDPVENEGVLLPPGVNYLVRITEPDATVTEYLLPAIAGKTLGYYPPDDILAIDGYNDAERAAHATINTTSDVRLQMWPGSDQYPIRVDGAGQGSAGQVMSGHGAVSVLVGSKVYTFGGQAYTTDDIEVEAYKTGLEVKHAVTEPRQLTETGPYLQGFMVPSVLVVRAADFDHEAKMTFNDTDFYESGKVAAELLPTLGNAVNVVLTDGNMEAIFPVDSADAIKDGSELYTGNGFWPYLEIMDLETGVIQRLPLPSLDLYPPDPPVLFDMVYGAAAAVGTKIYFGAGRSTWDMTDVRWFSFDTVTQEYAQLADAPQTLQGCFVGSIGGKVWAIFSPHRPVSGEYEPYYVYDPATDTWDNGTFLAAVTDGRSPSGFSTNPMTVVGGVLRSVSETDIVDFDPATLTAEWVQRIPVGDNNFVPATWVAPNGDVWVYHFVIASESEYQAYLETWDQSAERWTVAELVPEAQQFQAPASVLYEDKLLMTSGPAAYLPYEYGLRGVWFMRTVLTGRVHTPSHSYVNSNDEQIRIFPVHFDGGSLADMGTGDPGDFQLSGVQPWDAEYVSVYLFATDPADSDEYDNAVRLAYGTWNGNGWENYTTINNPDVGYLFPDDGVTFNLPEGDYFLAMASMDPAQANFPFAASAKVQFPLDPPEGSGGVAGLSAIGGTLSVIVGTLGVVGGGA